jgi:hypothetical protein
MEAQKLRASRPRTTSTFVSRPYFWAASPFGVVALALLIALVVLVHLDALSALFLSLRHAAPSSPRILKW